MKKIRIVLLLAALGFSGLVIYQNMGYLSTPANLQMNLWVTGPLFSRDHKRATDSGGFFCRASDFLFFRPVFSVQKQ